MEQRAVSKHQHEIKSQLNQHHFHTHKKTKNSTTTTHQQTKKNNEIKTTQA